MVEVQLSDSPEVILKKLKDEVGLDRTSILQYLDVVIKASFNKMSSKNCNNSERQGWGRLIINACSVALPALRDFELSELKVEVAELRRLVEGRN